jgi:assimilatory nitrate reductase catalytic subunit
MSRTGTVAQLYNHAEEPVLSMNSDDMSRRQLQDGDLVKVSSRRGNLVIRVQQSDEMLPTQTFMPMHWGRQQMNGMGSNALTIGAFDPISKQPELKHAAIKVEKLNLPWSMVLMRRGVDMLTTLDRLQPLLGRFDYASSGLYGRGEGILIMRAASSEAAPPELIDELDALLGITEDVPAMTYSDPRRGISKRVLVENGKVTGVRLVGETLAAEWLKQVMTQQDFPESVRLWALAPLSAPPTGSQSRGRIICNCLDVSEQEIAELVAAGADLPALQAQLKCGTECGSCVPELKRLVNAG